MVLRNKPQNLKLRMNQTQLTNIYLDQSKDHIWIFNLDFQLLYANQRWLSLVKEVAGVDQEKFTILCLQRALVRDTSKMESLLPKGYKRRVFLK